MPAQGRPDVDSLANLSAAIIVDQERMGANSRSTMGTATDAYSMLRIIFSRLGEPHVGPSNLFSFNDPGGMCPDCEGIGKVSTVDVDAMVDRDRSLNEGAILLPNFGVGNWYWQMFADSGYFDVDAPLRDYTPEQWERFLHGPEAKIRRGSFNFTYEGLVDKFRRLYLSKDVESMQPHVRAVVERVATFAVCAACGGTRLNEAARGVKVEGRTIAECAAMQVSDLADFVAGIDEPSVAPMLAMLRGTLDNLVEIGLGYLSLDRESATLSGGEAQRVKMVRHLGSSLTDITYVFDEPTVGLHPHDVDRMNGVLQRLRDKGNTVLVVEHKPEVIAIADHVVDMGPGAGGAGGTRRLRGRRGGAAGVGHRHRDPPRAAPAGQARPPDAHGAPADRRRPAAQPAATSPSTSPSACSRSSPAWPGRARARSSTAACPAATTSRFLDQSAIRGSRRSNPATYTGLLEPIRKAFAKANGVKPALFSANSEGACPECKGIGLIYTDLAFMAGVASPCEACEGKRFTPEVLALPAAGARTSARCWRCRWRRRTSSSPRRPVRPMLDVAGRRRPRLRHAGPAAEHAVGRRAPAASSWPSR